MRYSNFFTKYPVLSNSPLLFVAVATAEEEAMDLETNEIELLLKEIREIFNTKSS